MESTSKFNLESSLAQWKNALLLDETDNLRTKGLDEEEAFFVARKRLGETNLLVSEFEKLDDNLLSFSRVRFLIVGFIFSWFLTYFVQIIFLFTAIISFYFYHTFESITTATTVMSVIIGLVSLILYRLFVLKKIKTLGIFGNIPFLIVTMILTRIIITVYTQQSSLNFSIYGRAVSGTSYFWIGLIIVVTVTAFFIHFKARKRKTLAN